MHDGPGIRTTCFMKGCPLRCLWCHSPESQEFPPELNQMEIKCVGTDKCGRCLGACPQGAISKGQLKMSPKGDEEIQHVTVDRAKCTECFECTRACPTKSLYICGTDYTVDELFERVKRDKPFFENSGGGVTVSGGECLYQPEFLLEFLRLCKADGMHTAVDTTGHVKWELLEQILPYTDLFLYDLKHMDSDMHVKGTGVPNELILENARRLAAAGANLQIRIPVMPLYNESEAEFARYGEFIRSLGGAVEIVQLLPYHSLGVSKWARLGRSAPPIAATPPSDELMQARRAQLEAMGLPVTIH